MCGDCCDPINLSVGQLARMHEYGRWYADGNRYDPDDEGFAEDRETKGRERVAYGLERHVQDCLFALEHWTSLGPCDWSEGKGENAACDRFDTETRLCTAHDDRPPVCRDYPWYGGEVTEERKLVLPTRCSFREVPVTLVTKQEVG